MRVSVVQPGARLHYAVPAIFAREGVLRRLYTDLHAGHGWIEAARRLLPARATPKPVRRMFGRRLPPELPPRLVHDRPLETVARHLAAAAGLSGHGPVRVERGLMADLERSGLGPGDTLYTVLVVDDIPTLRRLRERGVTIVHECILGPDAHDLIVEENARFPGLERDPGIERLARMLPLHAEKYAACDAILVPSAFTERAVRAMAPPGVRIESVPYGVDVDAFDRPPARPVPGRVLCVGTVGLRKGHPYLAAAARELARRDGCTFEVRVVGPVAPEVTAHPAMAGPAYLGQVPRGEVPLEFARADVFAFPTICDSFGVVLVEALAMGVPVVTTPHCGDIVRDGVEGFVVPVRDPAALADAIARIVEDRPLRARMSEAARERAGQFSLPAYAERLMRSMRSIEAEPS